MSSGQIITAAGLMLHLSPLHSSALHVLYVPSRSTTCAITSTTVMYLERSSLHQDAPLCVIWSNHNNCWSNALQTGSYTTQVDPTVLLYQYTAERRDVFPCASRLEAVFGHSLSISIPVASEYPNTAKNNASVKINQ